MSNQKIYFVYLLLIVLGGCSSLISDQPKTADVRLIDSQTLLFEGETSEENVNELTRFFIATPNAVKTLIISSPGGDVLSGIRLGKIVYNNQLNVVVRNICASSCANYVVTASRNVLIEKGAILGWHGGSLQQMYSSFEVQTPLFLRLSNFIKGIDSEEKNNAFLQHWKIEERAFFD